MRQVSQEGVALIKRFEGLETQAYQDVAGVWTIGYGHTGPEVGPGMTITEAEAEQLLLRDLERFERGVADAVDVPVTQSQFDALVSLAYNIGVSAFRRSTALKRINKGDFEGAAEAITWWNKATVNGRKKPILGLTRRRSAEAALFLQDVGDDERVSPGVEVVENSPRRSNPLNSRTVGGATTAGAAGAVGAGSAVMRDRGDGGSQDASPQVVEGDVDRAGPANPTDEEGTELASAEETSDAPSTGCLDPETGEYLLPAELAAARGEPLPPPLAGPIDAAAADQALEAVDPTPCPEDASAVVLAEAEAPREEAEVADAVGIGAGALAVFSAIYVVVARVDDWLKFRR